MKKNKIRVASVLLAASTLFAFGATACGGETGEKPYAITKRARTGHTDTKEYTFNDYTSQMPDRWNTILTNDATNVDMASYLGSSFFEFDYKLDESGAIVPGDFSVDYSAATKLEDVTARYVGQYGITAEDVAEGHHAFAITLREDLKWNDGTAIKAADFVYTMQQQLSPDYLFETASNYYSGNYIIHNSKEYLYQGQSDWFDNATIGYTAAELDLTTGKLGGCEAYIALKSPLEWLGGYTLEFYTTNASENFNMDAWAPLAALADAEGKVAITAESVGLLASLISTEAWGETAENVKDYMFVNYTFPAMDFSEVGYFVGANEYELVIVFDNTLSPIDENGNLTYEAAYYLQDMPLVKRDLWEACADKTTTPWTNKYCSIGVENTASWGPYMLTNYQADMTYTVSRNSNWYGYNMTEYADQFQTDKIVCNKVTEWSTAWQMFQKGEIDGVGMDVSIAAQYRNSRQAYFTPDTYTFSLNLQSRANRTENNGTNKLLNYASFRKAISLMLDRDDYCAKNSPSSLAALGLLNNMYYYDVANGGVYRETTQAKEAILNAYGAEKVADGWKVGGTTYADIDDALDATTGYNLTLARQLMNQAYEEAKAAGDYTDGMDVVLTYGIEQESENITRIKNWFQAAFDAATVGTPLEGKIKIEYYYFSSATWSSDFEEGKYDLCFSAWGNAAFNPYYLLGETQIADANRYAQGWDPEKVELTVEVQGDGTEKCPGGSYTFNLKQWNSNMQGKSDATVNFSLYPTADRLTILGAIETAVLSAYYSVPVYSRYSASLISYKCDYNSYEYNTFVGYGGMRYMTYHFDDAEWATFVSSKGGTLNYLFGRDA